MGIMDFIKGGVREMMIARPDALKHLIAYKHPDQNIPNYAQLTVDSDECALFFREGEYKGYLPTGRHMLSSQNIPFLNNLVNKFTGGDVFIAEVFFVKNQPVRGIPFGGPLESIEDPVLHEFVTPRIFGEFSLVVIDPVRFIVTYFGQASGSNDNDQTLKWIRDRFFLSVKSVIGRVFGNPGPDSQRTLLNLGGMSGELAASIVQNAPDLAEVGCKILDISNFNINFSPEDNKLLRDANKARGEAKRGVGIAADIARAKQFELDQKFQQDARYVRDVAGNYQNYAAGQALVGAGQGMAQGGASAGVAGLGAQMAVGVGMANMMQGFTQQPPVPQAALAAPAASMGSVACGGCSKTVPLGKFCQECGAPLAPTKKFCTGCGSDVAGARFCASCGTKAQ